MSNPIVAAAGAGGGRPRTVTIARALTFLIAVLLVIAGVAFVATVLSLKATVTGPSSDQLTSDQVNQGLHVLGAVGGVGILILVAGQLTAGFLLGRANNAGRVTAWIFDGVTLLCCGCGLASSFINNSAMNTTSNGQSVTIDTGSSSTALGGVVAGAVGLALLAAMAVIILLVLPDSSDYFRRPPTVWSPGQQWPAQPPAFGAPGGWQPPTYVPPAVPPAPGQQPPAHGQPPASPGAVPPPQPPAPQPPYAPPAFGQPPAPGQPPTPGQPGGQPPTWGPPPGAPPGPYGPPHDSNPNDPTAPPSEQR
jgi:hypothetical protein